MSEVVVTGTMRTVQKTASPVPVEVYTPKFFLKNPGMFLNATIFLSATNAFTVPEDTVVRYGNKEYVLQEHSKADFKLVVVQTGIRQNGRVQLIDSTGLLSQKPVITKNAYAVLPKMKNTNE